MSIVDTLLGRSPDPAVVVREYGPLVHRHLRRIFGPSVDVDDVFQNVFVEILRSLPSFRGRSRLSTWIRRITWNVAYQEMRLRYRHQRLTPLENVDGILNGGQDTEEIAAAREAMARLYAGIETLPPKQRLAVIMHDIEEQTLKEMSQTLGRPVQTIASQLYTGREKLARWMRAAPGAKGDRLGEISERGEKGRRP